MHAPELDPRALSLVARNRRRSHRHPVGFYVEQIIDDAPHRCFTSDLSPIGMYMERLAEPLQRRTATVQLEIPLPKTGDSLWAIAQRFYGDGSQYSRIFEANRDQLDNPDTIQPGQVLRIPS